MVLNYIPCSVTNFSNLFKDYKKLKKLNVKEMNELFWDLLDSGFCKFIITKGKYKGKLCMKPIKEQFVNDGHCYCRTHRYQETECKIINCGKKRRKGYDFCTKHYKMKTKIESVNDNNEIKSYNKKKLFLNMNVDNYYYYPFNNIYDIKIRNISTLPKYFNHSSIYYSYNNQPVIKYNKFSLMKFLYNIYNKFIININDFLKKHKINTKCLYYLLILIKELNEKYYSKDIILYKNKFVFNKNIYEYIINEKFKRLYEYICKIYNTNYINIFNVILESTKNNQLLLYNNVNIYMIYTFLYEKHKKIENNSKSIKMSTEQRKEKKKLQKFNVKYNKLLKINEETLIWTEKTLKTNLYKENIYNIINEHMEKLDEIINIHGKDINFIRNTYRTIYSYLCDGWEFYPKDDELEKHDFKIVYNSDTWKRYGSHEDEEFKRLFKI